MKVYTAEELKAMDAVTLRQSVIDDAVTISVEKATDAALAQIGKRMGIPDGTDYKAVNDLLEAAGIPTKKQLTTLVIDSLKSDGAQKFLRPADDKKSPVPFTFTDFLGAVAWGKSRANPSVTREVVSDYLKSSFGEDRLKAFDLSGTGALLVPEFWANSLIEARQPASPAIQRATMWPMAGKRVMHFPRIDTLVDMDVYWEAFMPGTAKTETAYPTVDKPDLTLQNWYILWRLTHDMLDFNAYGIDALLQKWAAGSILRELDRLMLVGDVGAGDPYDGILNTAGVDNIALLAPGTLDYLDLRNLRSQLAAEYWGDAVYILNQAALYQVEALEDLVGMPVWFRDPTGVRPSTIDGYPYIIDNNIPNNIGGANQTVIFFGVASYWFQGNGGMAFSMSEHAKFEENMNCYKLTGYGDGFFALPLAMNYLEAVPTT